MHALYILYTIQVNKLAALHVIFKHIVDNYLKRTKEKHGDYVWRKIEINII